MPFRFKESVAGSVFHCAKTLPTSAFDRPGREEWNKTCISAGLRTEEEATTEAEPHRRRNEVWSPNLTFGQTATETRGRSRLRMSKWRTPVGSG